MEVHDFLKLVVIAICTKFTGALLIDEPIQRRIVVGRRWFNAARWG